MKIESIRKSALSTWLKGTSRSLTEYSDDIDGTYECEWMPENTHVSLFCSLGSWAGCLTQVLSDERYDNINLDASWIYNNGASSDEYVKRSEPIYQYYVRVLLIANEVLSDLVVIISAAMSLKEQKTARNKLSSNNGINLNDLQQFINTVTKHKVKYKYKPQKCEVNGYHLCNKHLIFLFRDVCDLRSDEKLNSLTISTENLNLNFDTPIFLEMPSLLTVVDSIVNAYKKIDSVLKDDNLAYKKLIEIFKDFDA